MAINLPFSIPASLFYPKKGFRLEKAHSVVAVDNAADLNTPIMLDLILSESHTLESEVSSQPIQKGSDLSIHVKQKLLSGSLTGLISNWGLNQESFLGDYAQSVLSKNEQRENRAKTTWQRLKRVMKEQIPMTIVCALEVYRNVIITGLKADRNGESGESQEFEIKFQHLNVVKLQREVLSVVISPSKPLATKKVAPTAPASDQKKAAAAKQVAPKVAAGKTTTVAAERVLAVQPRPAVIDSTFVSTPLRPAPTNLVKTTDPYINREVLGNFLKMHN